MGSLAREMSGFQLWIKPLSPPQGGAKAASFFVVAVNTNDDTTLDIPMVFSDWYRGDFAPAQFDRAKVTDLWQVPPKLLGEFGGNYTARAVAPHASAALRIDVLSADEATVSAKTDDDRAQSSGRPDGYHGRSPPPFKPEMPSMRRYDKALSPFQLLKTASTADSSCPIGS